jgi:hypothetical protein
LATFIFSTFCLNPTRTHKVNGDRIQFQERRCPCAYLDCCWCHHFYLQQIGADMPGKIHSHVFILFSQVRCLSGKLWLIVRVKLPLQQLTTFPQSWLGTLLYSYAMNGNGYVIIQRHGHIREQYDQGDIEYVSLCLYGRRTGIRPGSSYHGTVL